MFGTLKTLIQGANARAEDRVRAAYSIELIDQKIREASAGLRLAKVTLGSLILRQRAEERQIAQMDARVKDLLERARSALAAGREDLATEAAEAVAALENELCLRRETLARLQARVIRLQASVQATNRRVIDLRQGAVAARALHDEQAMQARLNSTLAHSSPLSEAEDLIAGVMAREDICEQAEILTEINNGLSRSDVVERLAASGFGRSTRTTTADVLARLHATT